MAEEMFDGFDHAQYKDEVQERWGAQAYADSDRWWSGLDAAGKQGFKDEAAAIQAAWAQALALDLDPQSAQVQMIAARHYAWITAGWAGKRPTAEQLAGLADMYVADERFAANYGGRDGAAYVRDGLIAFALSAGLG